MGDDDKCHISLVKWTQRDPVVLTGSGSGRTAAHRCGRLCWLHINSARYGCAVAVRTGCLEQGKRG